MLKRFFPKQPNFFKELSKIAELATQSADRLTGLAKDSPDVETIAKNIADLEHEADVCFRNSLKNLTDTFITPIEREHLHSLFITIDDVVDRIHAVSSRMSAYRMNTLTPGTREMIITTKECVSKLEELTRRIDEIKEPVELHRLSKEIKVAGNKVGAKLQTTLAKLYESSAPAPELFKERDIVLLIHKICESAEEVTIVLESILLDQA